MTDTEFTSAVELLRRIIPEEDFPAYALDVSPATVYTTLVTLWMLTLQRLGGGKSMAAVIKDLLTHNLVVQLRREAAKIAGVKPRRLSFTGVWTTMQVCLLQQPPCTASEWLERYERALRSAANNTLPNRPGRSHPRRAHPRRTKSTKFMQQNTKKLVPHELPEKPK